MKRKKTHFFKSITLFLCLVFCGCSNLELKKSKPTAKRQLRTQKNNSSYSAASGPAQIPSPAFQTPVNTNSEINPAPIADPKFLKAEVRTIGAILPLSGKNASIGQRALRGITMGLGASEAQSPFQLSVIDSEGAPDQARRAVERLAAENNVVAILGSVLSKESPQIAAQAEALGIPLINLSPKSGITDVGPHIFRHALTNQMMVRELVRACMENKNFKKFAILYPNDSFGTEYANLFWDEVLARGGSIVAAQSYNPKDTDFREVAQRLAETFYLDAREWEYRKLYKEKFANKPKLKKVSRKEEAEEISLPAITDYDAIFIPDSAKALTQLSGFLSYEGIRNVTLLGTNLWNSQNIAKKVGSFANQLLFVDAYMPTSDEFLNSAWVANYQKKFSETPSLIEVQSFEAAFWLRSVLAQGVSSREDLADKLRRSRVVPGLWGPLELSSEREVLRPLLVLQTDHNEVSILKK